MTKFWFLISIFFPILAIYPKFAEFKDIMLSVFEMIAELIIIVSAIRFSKNAALRYLAISFLCYFIGDFIYNGRAILHDTSYGFIKYFGEANYSLANVFHFAVF